MYPKLTIRDYTGGLNTNNLPTELYSDSAMQFSVLNNLLVDKVGRLRARPGEYALIPSQASAPQGMVHFINENGDFVVVAIAGEVIVYHTSGMTLFGTVLSGLSTSADINFASLYTYLYITDGALYYKWDGLASTAQLMGIEAPGAGTEPAPQPAGHTITDATNATPIVIDTTVSHGWSTGNTVTVGGAQGNTAANGTHVITVIDASHFSLNGTTGNGVYVANTANVTLGSTVGNLTAFVSGGNGYRYTYTFVNANGVESNPSPITVFPVYGASMQMFISGITVSSDPQVTQRRLYRTGGTSTAFRFVDVINDNTTTTYTDNIADRDLSLTEASFNHDRPPVGVTYFYPHRNRLHASGNSALPYRSYVSTYQQPEYWPVVFENQLTDGAFFDVSPTMGDDVVGYGENGSILLIFNKRSVYALFGDTFEDGGAGFTLRQITSKGCLSRRTIADCVNQTLYLSFDRNVYAITASEPTLMSLDIQPTLKGLTDTEVARACALYHDNRYLLFILRDNGSTLGLCYDFRVKCWTEMSDPLLSSTQLDHRVSGDGGELWLMTHSGYRDKSGALYNGIVAALNETLTNDPIPIHVTSPMFEFEERTLYNRARRITIEGSCTPYDVAQPARVRITATSPGLPSVSHTYKLARTTGTLLDRTVHSDLVGRRLHVELYGTVKTAQIEMIEMQYGDDLREKH